MSVYGGIGGLGAYSFMPGSAPQGLDQEVNKILYNYKTFISRLRKEVSLSESSVRSFLVLCKEKELSENQNRPNILGDFYSNWKRQLLYSNCHELEKKDFELLKKLPQDLSDEHRELFDQFMLIKFDARKEPEYKFSELQDLYKKAEEGSLTHTKERLDRLISFYEEDITRIVQFLKALKEYKGEKPDDDLNQLKLGCATDFFSLNGDQSVNRELLQFKNDFLDRFPIFDEQKLSFMLKKYSSCNVKHSLSTIRGVLNNLKEYRFWPTDLPYLTKLFTSVPHSAFDLLKCLKTNKESFAENGGSYDSDELKKFDESLALFFMRNFQPSHVKTWDALLQFCKTEIQLPKLSAAIDETIALEGYIPRSLNLTPISSESEVFVPPCEVTVNKLTGDEHVLTLAVSLNGNADQMEKAKKAKEIHLTHQTIHSGRISFEPSRWAARNISNRPVILENVENVNMSYSKITHLNPVFESTTAFPNMTVLNLAGCVITGEMFPKEIALKKEDNFYLKAPISWESVIKLLAASGKETTLDLRGVLFNSGRQLLTFRQSEYSRLQNDYPTVKVLVAIYDDLASMEASIAKLPFYFDETDMSEEQINARLTNAESGTCCLLKGESPGQLKFWYYTKKKGLEKYVLQIVPQEMFALKSYSNDNNEPMSKKMVNANCFNLSTLIGNGRPLTKTPTW